MDLLGLVGLVVARELVEDRPAAPAAVVVVGRRRLRVPVGVGILQCVRRRRKRRENKGTLDAATDHRCMLIICGQLHDNDDSVLISPRDQLPCCQRWNRITYKKNLGHCSLLIHISGKPIGIMMEVSILLSVLDGPGRRVG